MRGPSIVAFRHARLLLCALCFLSAANGLEAAGSVALAATLPLLGRLLSLSLASKHREIAGRIRGRGLGKPLFGNCRELARSHGGFVNSILVIIHASPHIPRPRKYATIFDLLPSQWTKSWKGLKTGFCFRAVVCSECNRRCWGGRVVGGHGAKC